MITQLEGQWPACKNDSASFIPQQARTSSSTARCPNISRPLPAVCKRKCNAMIRSLKDILVVSDMDNTLLTPEDGRALCEPGDHAAVLRAGGHFTVATGRTMESAGRHLDSMTLSAPAILYGGALFTISNTISASEIHCCPSRRRAGRCAMYWRVFREWAWRL